MLRQRLQRRRGAYLVELAFVVMFLVIIIFGIYEYSRLIFVQQMVYNAAREGARFAVVNTTDTTVIADTQAYVKIKMCGLDTMANCNYKCQVYQADDNGNNLGDPASALFGQYVAVQIDYDFQPVFPALLFWNNSIHVSSKTMMYSEAN
jgi:Flp pilus assembly protein TadG